MVLLSVKCSVIEVMIFWTIGRRTVKLSLVFFATKNGNGASVTRPCLSPSTSLNFNTSVETGRWCVVRVTGKQFTALGLIPECNHKRKSKIHLTKGDSCSKLVIMLSSLKTSMCYETFSLFFSS